MKNCSTCFVISLLMYSYTLAYGQNWMAGYSYRKKITVDKNKVVPALNSNNISSDLIDFPLLISFEDQYLIHIPGSCTNKISNNAGMDISFALATSPATALDFQVDSYDAGKGKLTCWVRIPLLSAKGTTSAATSIYFYYGSDRLQDNYSASGLATWSVAYNSVCHLNQDVLPATSKNANTLTQAQQIKGSSGMNHMNYTAAKIGTGIKLNGISESCTSNPESSGAFTISCWIKLNDVGKEQVITASDTAFNNETNGYQLKINSAGQLVLSLYRNILSAFDLIAPLKLLPDNWYYIAASSTGKDITLYIDGNRVGNRSNTTLRYAAGGAISIGSSKQHTQYFNGLIDEFRIQNTVKNLEWITTEYTNQNNPLTFYTLYEEEYNPLKFARFTGSKNSLWNEVLNWSTGIVPGDNASITINAGKKLSITNGAPKTFNRLTLEAGALITVEQHVTINCLTEISTGAIMTLGDGVNIEFGSHVTNNGSITTQHLSGSIICSGRETVQRFTGQGKTKVYGLVNQQTDAGHALTLSAPIQITGYLNLIKGNLASNGQLCLAADSAGETATLLPVQHLDEASITGEVDVEQYIDGDYPAPATARGWRLLSSPVYHTSTQSQKKYTISAYKNSVFVTGNGGIQNGFDPSPLNGGTIYSHDQSLPGTLSKKYTAIANAAEKILFGKGIYLFSRGSRMVENAYLHQIQQAPFSNPAGYLIKHTGFIYTGDLTVDLANQNTGEEGEGFNLLGNPYPSDLNWGKLIKNNLSNFIWLHDPLNNAYVVTDASSTIIPSGSGFFVKVKSGSTSGSLTFTEQSKYLNSIIPKALSYSKNGKDQVNGIHVQAAANDLSLTLVLKKDCFKQPCVVNFRKGARDEVDNEDAIKMGEGYVSIASLVNDIKLSIDTRAQITEKKQIDLYIKGWEPGNYSLSISLANNNGTAVTLIDHLLNIHQQLLPGDNLYEFDIQSGQSIDQDKKRFALSLTPDTVLFKPQEKLNIQVLSYPNPFNEKLFLKILKSGVNELHVTITDILGQTVLQQEINAQHASIEVNTVKLNKGIYFLQIFSSDRSVRSKVFKLLKN